MCPTKHKGTSSHAILPHTASHTPGTHRSTKQVMPKQTDPTVRSNPRFFFFFQKHKAVSSKRQSMENR